MWVAVESVLLVFGADFSGQQLGPRAAIALVHLAGVALAGWGVARAVRRFAAEELVVQVLAVAAVVLLVAYMIRGTPSVGGGAHEIAGVLPIGAVLAGRFLAGQLIRGRHITALAVVLACYIGILAHDAVQQSRSDASRPVTSWLQANHLRYGLADYWNANVMTVDSGNRVQIRSISSSGNHLVYSPWESENSWYEPTRHEASFVVLPGPASGRSVSTVTEWQAAARATFGSPSGTYRVAGFVVLVWHTNLLSQLITEAPHQPIGC